MVAVEDTRRCLCSSANFTYPFPYVITDAVAWSDLWRCRRKALLIETTSKAVLGHVFRYKGTLFSKSTQIEMSLCPPRPSFLLQALQKHTHNKDEMEMAFSVLTSPQRITYTLGIDGAPFTGE